MLGVRNKILAGYSPLIKPSGCLPVVGGAVVRQVMWEGVVTDPAIGCTVQSVDHEPLRFVYPRSQGASEGVGLAAQAHRRARTSASTVAPEKATVS
jgi:hypothetical protein